MKLSLSLFATSVSSVNSTWQEQLRLGLKTLMKMTLERLQALGKSINWYTFFNHLKCIEKWLLYFDRKSGF